MMKYDKGITVLMADDDADDRMLLQEAWDENRIKNRLRFVENGEELLDYLFNRGKYAAAGDNPRPGLILLDLNMPVKDGREALEEIRTNPDFMKIPVVVLTTSKADEDIVKTYMLGISGFICKPVTFDGLVEVVKGLRNYWFEIVELPFLDTGAAS